MESKNVEMKQLIENNNKNYGFEPKRDSFSDRICDDLCEVLLKYLSIDDKIKFECISKQFQRCVYTKQNSINIYIS
jgi:septum formation topological specificity factor MinE